MKKNLKEFFKRVFLIELGPIYLFLISIILILSLLVIGLIHLVCKSVYETFQVKFWKGPARFITYWFKLLYQCWNVIKYLSIQLAISIDLFGNVACGEAIEDIVTAEENTLYGQGEITISSATGDLELRKKLNKTGIGFSNILSKTLGEKHCIQSYEKDEYIKKFKTGI